MEVSFIPIHIKLDSYLHFQIQIARDNELLRFVHLFGSNVLFGSCKVVMEKIWYEGGK
jgi:hypothetical protein